MECMLEYLKARPYPGRGIMAGCSSDGKNMVVAYFIMGRSVNSRNRVFEATEDGIRTKAFDESQMVDPSLIIYHPVRRLPDGTLVVTNGDQTDTIANAMNAGKTAYEALLTRTFEPDGPNWTPRVSAVIDPSGTCEFSILKSNNGSDACSCRQFFNFETPVPGEGHFISTYVGAGDPIPSFIGEPVLVGFPEGEPADIAEKIWDALDADNKVSLYVATIDLTSGDLESVIINKNE